MDTEIDIKFFLIFLTENDENGGNDWKSKIWKKIK